MKTPSSWLSSAAHRSGVDAPAIEPPTISQKENNRHPRRAYVLMGELQNDNLFFASDFIMTADL